MAVSSVGLRLKCDCSGETQKQFNSKLQTRSLVKGPKRRPDTQTYWSTDCRPQDELQLQPEESQSTVSQ
jgi:hypothetical protein